MNPNEDNKKSVLSRRDALKLAGLSLGGLAAGGRAFGSSIWNPIIRHNQDPHYFYPTRYSTTKYSYYDQLKPITPWGKTMDNKLTGTKLDKDEMRITFMGSTVPMARRAQAEMSIFVEVGWNDDTNQPEDQFIFDFGCGVSANYQACGVGYGRMDKIFINHLHADHTSDLIQVYGFGDGGDRKSPLFMFGQAASGVPNPGNTPSFTPGTNPPNPHPFSNTPATYDDGLRNFCYHLRETLRWHTESQAFQTTAYDGSPTLAELKTKWGLSQDLVPVSDDPPNDANAIVPIELPWWIIGLDSRGYPTGDNVAYNNTGTRARVLHYPVIHCRKGSMGYKLEWTPPNASKPLVMTYSSDTKPEWNSIYQAINYDEQGNAQGIDVFIHEMAVAPAIWAMKNQGLSKMGSGAQWDATVNGMIEVQDSSHTPQGAYGYMLSEICKVKAPRLAVATHFPTADDTVTCALESVQEHFPNETIVNGKQLVWSFDLMVLRVYPDKIEQRRAVVNDFSFDPPIPASDKTMYAPKYHYGDNDPNGGIPGQGNPFAQIDTDNKTAIAIPPTEKGGYNNQATYAEDGY